MRRSATTPSSFPTCACSGQGRTMKSQLRRELPRRAPRPRPHRRRRVRAGVVEDNLDRAEAIRDYKFPVVEIKGERSTEEDVAEIFVRINNQGTRLGQADFVLTLLAVFHRELRDLIETRRAPISQGVGGRLDTQGLLRTAVALGFKRGRMSAVYRFLRGVDADSGDTSPDAPASSGSRRSTRRGRMRRPADLGRLPPPRDARGLRRPLADRLGNAIVYAYAMYVLGKRMGVSKPRLERADLALGLRDAPHRALLGSTETVFEQDLARVSALRPRERQRLRRRPRPGPRRGVHRGLLVDPPRGRARDPAEHAPSALAFRAAQVVLEGTRAVLRSDAARPPRSARVQGGTAPRRSSTTSSPQRVPRVEADPRPPARPSGREPRRPSAGTRTPPSARRRPPAVRPRCPGAPEYRRRAVGTRLRRACAAARLGVDGL